MNIRYSLHAKKKIKERGIKEQIINNVINNPEKIVPDKFDDDLFHYIKRIKKKFLRVVCKIDNENQIIIISAFFDRRLKRSKPNDKNRL